MTVLNPFLIRTIGYGEPFCDREEETRKIVDSSSRSEAVCLLSPRRYGKTSLFNQVMGRFSKEDWIVLHLDLMQIHDLRSFVERLEAQYAAALSLWARLARAARESISGLRPEVEIDSLTGSPTFSLGTAGREGGEERRLLEILRKITELPERTGRWVCVVFDEFQQVANYGPKRHIEGVIRSVFQTRPGDFFPCYLGSKYHMMKLMFEDPSAPFYRSARVLELGPLPGEAFSSFVKDQFEGTLGVEIPLPIAEATYRLFGGHPYAMNKTAAYLWTAFSANRDPAMAIAAWKRVVWDVISEERRYYEIVNECIPAYTRVVLQKVALKGAAPNPYSKSFAKECGLTPGQIQNAVKLLSKEDKIVIRDDGELALADPLEAICVRSAGVQQSQMEDALDRLLHG